jgi:hypothetical protein
MKIKNNLKINRNTKQNQANERKRFQASKNQFKIPFFHPIKIKID